jgi:hypothetical protein
MLKTYENIINLKLLEIQNELKRHSETISRLREELLINAAYFSDYNEMYTFIKAHTPTFEAFCEDMQDARKYFDSTH